MSFDNLIGYIIAYGVTPLFVLLTYTVYILNKQEYYGTNTAQKVVHIILLLNIIIICIQAFLITIAAYSYIQDPHVDWQAYQLVASIPSLFQFIIMAPLIPLLLAIIGIGVARGNNTKK